MEYPFTELTNAFVDLLSGLKPNDWVKKTLLNNYRIDELVRSIQPNYAEPEENKYCYCWLLQQYIREALNSQDLLKKGFYSPFLNTVMQHLARHYQQISAEKGTLIKVEIVGEAGGVWMIEKNDRNWQSVNKESHPADVTVYLDQQIAWLLVSGALHLSEIGQFYQIIGNKALGAHFLGMKTNLTASQLKDS